MIVLKRCPQYLRSFKQSECVLLKLLCLCCKSCLAVGGNHLVIAEYDHNKVCGGEQANVVIVQPRTILGSLVGWSLTTEVSKLAKL